MDGLQWKAFSKGNLGLGLIGSGQNEDEWMTKGRSHGRLFLVFTWLFEDQWFSNGLWMFRSFSNGFSGLASLGQGVFKGWGHQDFNEWGTLGEG